MPQAPKAERFCDREAGLSVRSDASRATDIAEEIAQAFAQRYHLATRRSQPDEHRRPRETERAVSRRRPHLAHPDARLGFQLVAHGLGQLPRRPERNRAVDRPQRRSGLAAADCACRPEYAASDEAPSQDDLLSDRAAGPKAELKKGTDHCLKKLPTETLA